MDEQPVWSIYGLPNPGQANPGGTSAGQGQTQPLVGGGLQQQKQGEGYDATASKINDMSAAMGGTTALPSSGELIGKLLAFL
jgi:hypothetical protein